MSQKTDNSPVSPAHKEEDFAEVSLRPTLLREFVGQDALKEKMRIFHALLFQSSTNILFSKIMSIPFIFFVILIFIPKTREKSWLIDGLLLLCLVGSLISLISKFLSKDPVYDALFYTNFMVGSPLILFGIMVFRFSKGLFLRFVIVSAIIFILLFSLVSPLNGGMQWGSRFLLPLYSILTVFAVYVLDKILAIEDFIKKKFLMGLFIVAVLFSFANQMRGIKILYDKKQGSRKLIAQTEQLNTKNIMTDVWWYALDIAHIYFDKNIFYPRKRDGLNDITLSKLIVDLKDAGIDKFSLVAFTNRYNQYQPFLSKLPLTVLEKEAFAEKNLKFMNLYLVKYSIEAVNESNKGTYAEIYTRIGDYLCKDEFYEDGINYFRKSLETVPEGNPMPHFLMGQAYIRQNNWVKGLMELETAIRIMPENEIFLKAWKEANELYQAGLPPEKRSKVN